MSIQNLISIVVLFITTLTIILSSIQGISSFQLLIKERNGRLKSKRLLFIFIVFTILISLFIGYLSFNVFSYRVPAQNRNSTPTPPPVADKILPEHIYDSIIETSNPSIYDSLKTPSTNGWSVYQLSQGSCKFTDEAYHVSVREVGFVSECFAQNINLREFALQVDLTMVNGNMGGLIFRSSEASFNASMYRFNISQDGTYDVLYQFNNSQRYNPPCAIENGRTHSICFSSAIVRGLNKHNILTVIAENESLFYYVNGTFLISMQDNAPNNGKIGVFATDLTDPTEVVFRNVKIWKLS